MNAEQWCEFLNRAPVVPIRAEKPKPAELNRIIEQPVGRYRIELHGAFSLVTMAMAHMDDYLLDFPPAGYGTNFSPITQDGEYYIVRGVRFASCD